MSELPPLEIKEIGQEALVNLLAVLASQEEQRVNVVGWGGTSSELSGSVASGDLYPSSAFAVVAEGYERYKRSEAEARVDTGLMRKWSEVMGVGAHDYGQAKQIDGKVLLEQIRKYVVAHGGEFQEGTDWENLILEVSAKLGKKAKAIDEANM